MLSLLPELLFLSPFAALLIRVTAAIVFGYAAWKHFSTPGNAVRSVALVEGICAALLFVGAYTQAAALFGVVILAIHGLKSSLRTLPTSTALLLLILCLSLLVLGAGPFAFDLPL
jgi:hypothetical protein